uniref:Ion transport domain-containing protein n=1 Tax=Euplotes harpa TaxID=151035 RepID=A0A7S3JKB8_9SPIT|mmetsp:Transcript_42002/g.48665  ORF Transcript_42002/g.48665 Transcript_42002/m.48665 type:complete len:671 (+) Transcript_42002:2323-4335(+)
MSKKMGIPEKLWCQGVRINGNEDVILSNGTLITPLSYRDIYFRKYPSMENLDIQKVIYYMDKKSVAFQYIDDPESLSKVLALFENNHLYYSMLVLEDQFGKTPLDIAIENNSAKIIEVILNNLLKLDHFSLSKVIYKKFPILFKMNLKAFEKYLNTCYFVTQQMKSITKVRLQEGEDTIREVYSCCILDKAFYKKYRIGEFSKKIEEPIKDNAVAPIDYLVDQQKKEAEEELLNGKAKDKIFEEVGSLKRVTIKGIEFDWVFCSDEGESFLQYLSETPNINIFSQSIIRDIILFQWSFFKKMIILKLLVPYLCYFLIFCLYATYLLKNQNDESDKNGVYHIFSWIFGAIILVFNVFWAYIEVTQMMFHKLDYLTSFWNLLDLSSVALNSAVVIMDFADADFKNTNRVAAISVLILYFKLFYFLRVFFVTAYLVRMIIEIVIDMKNFVLVLIISIMAFGNSYYILGRNSDSGNLAGESVTDAFIFSYKMALGDFGLDGFNTKDEEILWIIFVINTIIVLVMLLNLVIAIMGDTFDRVQETQENSMLQELTQMIRENEFLFSRSRAFKRAKYIIVIEAEKAEGGSSVSWEGKLNQLKTFIEQSSEEHIAHLKKLQENIDTIAVIALDDKLRPIEDKINHKLSTCDQRLEKIRKSTDMFVEYVEDYISKLQKK